jgi:ribosomal protein L11 methylase PrmA
VAAALAGGGVRHVIASGVVPAELDGVADVYAAAGWRIAERRDQDGWAAARLEAADA